jgi:hypothetical protein
LSTVFVNIPFLFFGIFAGLIPGPWHFAISPGVPVADPGPARHAICIVLHLFTFILDLLIDNYAYSYYNVTVKRKAPVTATNSHQGNPDPQPNKPRAPIFYNAGPLKSRRKLKNEKPRQ